MLNTPRVDITDDTAAVAMQIRADMGLEERCGESTGAPYPGPESNAFYCRRFEGHERYGLCHRAEDGTQW